VDSSAVVLVLDINRLGPDPNLLECHPEASRGHNATTACVQVEEVPLQATPEGPKSFWNISGEFVTMLLSAYVCCSSSTLMIDLVGIMR